MTRKVVATALFALAIGTANVSAHDHQLADPQGASLIELVTEWFDSAMAAVTGAEGNSQPEELGHLVEPGG